MNTFFTIFVLLLGAVLLYLSVYDLKYKAIPLIPCILGLVLAGVFVILNTILYGDDFLLPTIPDAIAGGVVLATAVGALVYLTKEKAMGEGDIFLFGIMGISLGFSNLFTGFLICVWSATIYGVIVALIKRKFHRLQIPLVPFISLGILLTLIYHPNIVLIINRLMGLPF